MKLENCINSSSMEPSYELRHVQWYGIGYANNTAVLSFISLHPSCLFRLMSVM